MLAGELKVESNLGLLRLFRVPGQRLSQQGRECSCDAVSRKNHKEICDVLTRDLVHASALAC